MGRSVRWHGAWIETSTTTPTRPVWGGRSVRWHRAWIETSGGNFPHRFAAGPVNTRIARLLSLFGLIAVVSALAQLNSQFPVTNVAEPTPPPETSALLTPEKLLSSPTPAPVLSPTPSPTPLPDGTMPLPLPAMPTPVLENAKTLSEQLNAPIPRPASSRSHSLNPANGNSRQQSSFRRLIRFWPAFNPG